MTKENLFKTTIVLQNFPEITNQLLCYSTDFDKNTISTDFASILKLLMQYETVLIVFLIINYWCFESFVYSQIGYSKNKYFLCFRVKLQCYRKYFFTIKIFKTQYCELIHIFRYNFVATSWSQWKT